MLDVVLAGALTGLAIAVPVGAVGVLLVGLAARTSWRVGAAAALGVASVDGVYAALAVLAGAALAAVLAPAAGVLEVVAGLVLLAVAALLAVHAVRPPAEQPRPGRARRLAAAEPGPVAAYLLFVGLTALNPTTLAYFAAVVLGNPDLVDGPVQGVVFVLAALVASAVWQLVLAASGAVLGRAATGPRGRRVTGLVAAAAVAGLALHTMLG